MIEGVVLKNEVGHLRFEPNWAMASLATSVFDQIKKCQGDLKLWWKIEKKSRGLDGNNQIPRGCAFFWEKVGNLSLDTSMILEEKDVDEVCERRRRLFEHIITVSEWAWAQGRYDDEDEEMDEVGEVARGLDELASNQEEEYFGN